MRGLHRVLVGMTSLAAVGSAVQFNHRQNNATNTTSQPSPCAAVSSVISASPDVASPTVPARMAYDCLNSIPLNVSSASDLIDSMKPYIEWQSTLSYLKDPPAEYVAKVQQAVDVFAGLDAIKANAIAGKYQSEFQFGFDLYTLIQSTHDGHFVFVPDSVGLIFTWGRPVALVSVSEDGEKLPSVFVYTDVVDASFNNLSYTPSAVSLINGQDAASYLENFSQIGSLQDRDALYNNLFYNLAQISLGSAGTGTGTFSGGGRGRYVYPGHTTNLTFTNGTVQILENFARVILPFSGIQTGEDIASSYFIYSGKSSSVSAESVNEQKVSSPTINVAEKRQALSPPAGYPSPIVQASGNIISGYFLEGDGYDDVAVLAVPSFVGSSVQEQEFQNVGDQFLQEAVAAGKTKLIIDVSANGGGTILQAYDLFKKLFPSVLPYGASRFRAHQAANLVGQAFSDFSAIHPRSLSEPNATVLDIVSSYFNFRTDVNASDENFRSWPDKYGPHNFHGDQYTSLSRWNLSDVLTVVNSGGIDVTGYGSRSNYTTQPFDAKNVVIIYDGYCASTCTIFSELMTQQMGIKTIAFGGRPQTAPMQAVGGVKGANNYPWGFIQVLVQEAVDIGGAANMSTVLGQYYDDLPFARSAVSPGCNVRDGIRQGDESQTPLQFVYEAADCRIWYTPEMVVDVTEIWKAAADTQWNNKSRCVGTAGYGPTAKRVEYSSKLQPERQARKRNRDGMTYKALIDSLRTHTNLRDVKINADGFMMP